MFVSNSLASNMYFFVAVLYAMVGFYSISIEKKPLNKVFFWLALSLNVWSTASFLMFNAIDADMALMFHRFSVLGWGVCFSLMYHVSCLLSEPTKKMSLKFYLAVYTPAVICVILNFLNIYPKAQYCAVLTDYGFTTYDGRVWYLVYYYIYSVFFVALSFVEGYKFFYSKEIQSNSKNKKYSRLVSIVSVVSLFLILYVTFVSGSSFTYERVGFKPVLVGIPMMFIFYILTRMKVIRAKEVEFYENEFLRRDRLIGLFRLSGYGYIGLAYGVLLINFTVSGHFLKNQILVSAIIFLIGAVHFFIDVIFKTNKLQYYFIVITSACMMIFIIFRYANYGGTSIWAIFFYYIIIATVFEDMVYAYIISSALILTQFLFWLRQPRTYLVVDWTDYFARSLIVVFTTILMIYINRIYRSRIKEINRRSKLQSVFTQIFSKLTEIRIDKVSQKVNDSFELLNELFYADRSYCYVRPSSEDEYRLIAYKDDKISFAFEKTQIDEPTLVSTGIVDLDDIDLGDVLFVKVQKPYAYVGSAFDYLHERNIKSYVVLPMSNKDVDMILFYEGQDKRLIKELKNYSNTVVGLMAVSFKRINHEIRLYNTATYDEMTNVKNRHSFSKHVDSYIGKNPNHKDALLCLNIDNFKEINDAFGYSIGDLVIKNVANILSANGKKENLARFTSNEFVMFMPNIKDKTEVVDEINNIFEAFRLPIKVDQYEYKINLDAGISLYPDDGESFEHLIKNATIAMHEAKKYGKMKYHFSDISDRNKIFKKAIYTTKLLNAIENDELVLAFQPQMSLHTNEMIGAEVLVRWDSKDFGMVSPMEFIPILENTGMIIKVGEWIIEQSAKQYARMRELGYPKFRLAINLSSVQFEDPILVEKLRKIMDKWDIDPDYFELEITESATSTDEFEFLAKFNDIKNTGTLIAIDDFGTDFSSLSRLQKLPIDRLKIDKSFVDGIGNDPKKEAIVKIIIDLAKSLGLESIAEGVETEEQQEFLRNLGCDEIQGYFYSRPIFSNDFEEFAKM